LVSWALESIESLFPTSAFLPEPRNFFAKYSGPLSRIPGLPLILTTLRAPASANHA